MASRVEKTPQARERVRRAVSERDKEARRAAILTAAETHFSEVGFERFSMEVLAKRLGMARGTLYRYFGTREELLLTLYRIQQQRFVATLIARLNDSMSDQDFVRLFYQAARQEPILIALRLRLTSVIEHNVSLDVLLENKQSMLEDFELLSLRLGEALRLSSADSRALIVALLTLILGAAQADASPVIDPDLLPDDMRRLMAEFQSQPVFETNALLILEGLRRRA